MYFVSTEPELENTLLSKLFRVFSCKINLHALSLLKDTGEGWERGRNEGILQFLIGKPAFKYCQIFKPTFNGLDTYPPLPINLVELRTAAECPIPSECPVCSRHCLCWGFSFALCFLLQNSGVSSYPHFLHLRLVIVTPPLSLGHFQSWTVTISYCPNRWK